MQFRDDLLNDAAAGLSESAVQKIMEHLSGQLHNKQNPLPAS
jgi:hypothetical protein